MAMSAQLQGEHSLQTTLVTTTFNFLSQFKDMFNVRTKQQQQHKAFITW